MEAPLVSARDRLALSLRSLRRLLVGALLGYAAVSLTLGGTPHARTAFHLLALLWLLVIAAGYLRSLRRPVSGKAPAASGKRLARAGRVLEVVATNAALTLLLAEAALQTLAAFCGSSLLLTDTLDAYRLSPGRDYGGGLRGNSLGYPGPDILAAKAPGVRRVAALGDSFAVGPAVPFAENYLTRLQRALPGVEVCNFGVSAAGPREYRAVLARDVWPVRPDVVLVSVFVGNDITESLPTPRHFDPRSHAVYLLCERGWRLARERRRQSAEAPAALPDRLGAPPLSEEIFRAVEARRLAVCLTPPPPALERKWQRALAHLDRLVNDCRARAVPVAFVLIPDEFQVNPAVLEQAACDANLARGPLDLDLPQRRLCAFCANRDVPCLDLLPAFRGVPDTYAPRDTHWNVRGNRLAAAAIAEWLRERLPER
jgi:hypothetical protein